MLNGVVPHVPIGLGGSAIFVGRWDGSKICHFVSFGICFNEDAVSSIAHVVEEGVATTAEHVIIRWNDVRCDRNDNVRRIIVTEVIDEEMFHGDGVEDLEP